jgi:glycosyltransferase involved in cell wall biosynthesis
VRILHVSTRLILGGSQENTVLSCEGQARLGHLVDLAFGPIFGPEGSLLDRIQEFNRRCSTGEETVRPVGRHMPVRTAGEHVAPIVTHEIPHLVREIDPAADYRALRELRELNRRLGPDVVHTHSSKAGILGRFAAWGTPGTAVVHTIHGPPFMPVEGGTLSRLRRRVLNEVYAISERAAAARCHAIVSVADAMTEQFLARGIGRPEQFVTVYSGMETQAFLRAGPGEDRRSTRAALGFHDVDIVIGIVARLAEHKGHDDLLDALAEDLAADPRLRLLWVGDGWWRERLIARALALGISIHELDQGRLRAAREHADAPQLILTGLVPPERVPALMRSMDILAHPSYREGLPRTVPQALLCGVVPVAYDVDGTGEICRDDETGTLVPVGDRRALRDSIMRLVRDPADRARLAVTGRSECAEKFSCERMVAELEGVYARAISAARSAGNNHTNRSR